MFHVLWHASIVFVLQFRCIRYITDEKKISLASISFEIFDPELIISFLDYMENKNHWKPATRNQRLSCIRMYFKYAGMMDCTLYHISAALGSIPGYREQIASLRASVKSLKQSNDFHKKNYQESLAEKDAIIKELQNRLAHAEALLNHDGSNTGTPTSQTPINKNKVIPNSRRSSGRKKGGQPGHPKAALEAPGESEITDTVGHPLQAFALSLTNRVNAAMNKTSMFLAGITGDRKSVV